MNAANSTFGLHFPSQPGDSKELALVFIYFIYLLLTRKILKKSFWRRPIK